MLCFSCKSDKLLNHLWLRSCSLIKADVHQCRQSLLHPRCLLPMRLSWVLSFSNPSKNKYRIYSISCRSVYKQVSLSIFLKWPSFKGACPAQLVLDPRSCVADYPSTVFCMWGWTVSWTFQRESAQREQWKWINYCLSHVFTTDQCVYFIPLLV